MRLPINSRPFVLNFRSGINLSGLHNFTRSFWIQHHRAYGPEINCYFVGTEGACEYSHYGMKLEAQRGSIFGTCVCSCFFNPYRTNPFLDLENSIICYYERENRYLMMINGTCEPAEDKIQVTN